MQNDMMAKLARALRMQGDLYGLEDILEMVDSGDLQSFADGDTWAITSITDYPRRRVMDLLIVVGDLQRALSLGDRIVDFARAQGCTLLRADGREGWTDYAVARGWRKVAVTFYKDL